MTRKDTESEMFECEWDRAERLRHYAEHLVSLTTNPLLKEKIVAVLAGERTDH